VCTPHAQLTDGALTCICATSASEGICRASALGQGQPPMLLCTCDRVTVRLAHVSPRRWTQCPGQDRAVGQANMWVSRRRSTHPLPFLLRGEDMSTKDRDRKLGKPFAG
jgi:hypothetical protein